MIENKVDAKLIQKEENSVYLKISFPMECGLFQGHFPDLPLLPGVVQTHLAIRYFERYQNTKLNFAGFKSLKFFRPIFPGATVDLEIKKDLKSDQVTFHYSGGGHPYSKGVVAIHAD